MVVDMHDALYTFPSFYAMSQDPKLRHIVVPTLQRYGGSEAVKDYVGTKKTMIDHGIDAVRAQDTALYLASARADLREAERQIQPWFTGPMGPTQGKFRDALKKIGRGAAAVVTMGASEATYWAFRALPASEVKKKIREAANRGFDSFNDAVANSLRAFGGVDDWRDVLDIAKVVLSAGASIAQDSIIVGIQMAMMELVDPYLNKVNKMMGESYGKARRAMRKAAQKLVGRMGANDVVKEVIGEIVNSIYDLMLGYPPCVLEKACIQPIATALSKVDVVYVKAVGEALKVIYPIIQGNYQGVDMPQSSPATYLYASGEVPLLPNAKLPAGLRKTLNTVLEVIGDKGGYSVGVPEAFERFQPYLIDLVARGAQGPSVYGSQKRARHYFLNPLDAQKVLKQADRIGGILNKVDKYFRRINEYLEYGQAAYDLYTAIDGADFSFDLEEWNAEDFKKILGEKVQDLQSWAVGEVVDYKDRAMALAQNADQIASRMAMREVDKYKNIATNATKQLEKGKSAFSTVKGTQFQDILENARAKAGYEALAAKRSAASSAEDAYNQARSDVRKTINSATDTLQEAKDAVSDTRDSLTDTKNKILAPIRMFGSVSSGQAFLNEWMPAQIGLFARLRYNEMAELWLNSTPAERAEWKKAPASRWKDAKIDYPNWAAKFNNSETMKRMIVAQAAHKLPMNKLSIVYNAAKAAKSGTLPILTKVVDARGRAAGIKNLSKQDLSATAKLNKQRIEAAIRDRTISGTQLASFTNLARLSKIGINAVNPTAVKQKVKQEGLVGQTSSSQPKWLVPVAIAGAAVTGAAVLTALTE